MTPYESTLYGEETHLLGNDLGNLGIAVSQGVHSDTSSHIQIPPVLHIPQITALSLHHHRRRSHVGGDHVGCAVLNEGHCGRIGGRIGVWNRGSFLGTR